MSFPARAPCTPTTSSYDSYDPAYLEHGIDRVIIFDIDLHHGNGSE
jgi:hypothetical protein